MTPSRLKATEAQDVWTWRIGRRRWVESAKPGLAALTAFKKAVEHPGDYGVASDCTWRLRWGKRVLATSHVEVGVVGADVQWNVPMIFAVLGAMGLGREIGRCVKFLQRHPR